MIQKLPALNLLNLVVLHCSAGPISFARIEAADCDEVNRFCTNFKILRGKIAQNCVFVMQYL